MTYIVYGIKNCNSMKKAFDKLKSKGIEYKFHDYKKEGISENKLKEWSKQIGWETLLNKKGLTWKRLPEEERSKITNEKAAIALMTEKTSIIKRPLIEKGNKILQLGFNEEEFNSKF